MSHSERRTALITGATGQDGSYLAELLLGRGYRVVAASRRDAAAHRPRLGDRTDAVESVTIDLSDPEKVRDLVARQAPEEIYHLAAASRVDASWSQPMEALVHNAGSTANLLEAIRREQPKARMVVASSCEIFGRPERSPQSEQTTIAPASPYGVSKAAAFWMTSIYRESHGLHVSSAIMYNHESPRRSDAFVSRKISLGVARIACGQEHALTLGNLDARRDWGFAGDYVEALARMVQLERPRDLVLGTGASYSVRDFCEHAFAFVGLDYRAHVRADRALFRPVDPTSLVADARLAHTALGWSPTVTFPALVEMMVSADLERVRSGAVI